LDPDFLDRRAHVIVPATLLVALLVTFAAARSDFPRDLKALMETVSPDTMRAHVKFLASDLLEGRGTGQRGGEIAAEYIATQFELCGLRPAGTGDSFRQAVPLAGITTRNDKTTLEIATASNGRPLVFHEDFVIWSDEQRDVVDAYGPLVFVGYGIQAPEANWDDYKGMDVSGKILLMLVNDPPSEDPSLFGGEALTYYGRWTYKYEIAARLGAKGAFLVHSDAGAGYGWEVVKNSWGRERPEVARDANSPRALSAAGWLSEPFSKELLKWCGHDLETLRAAAGKRDFAPIELTARASAHVESDVRRFETANVLGRLEGGDDTLRDEAVFFTAHYDHLGIGDASETGDRIHNGAVDNASGVSILLELARVFSRSPVRPRRSIVFMGVAAEEGGLRGSAFYATHPIVPISKIAAVVNLDGIPLDGETSDFVFLGAERSSLRANALRAAQDIGFEIAPDPHPEQGSFYRSDQFSFAKAGVPGFLLDPGTRYVGKPENWGAERFREYNQKRYHRPSDEYRDDMDFSGAAKVAKIAFHVAWQVACEDALPAWNSGDEFEAARKKAIAGSQ
jgi:Zn-dependent M28 family amino/carboxypeptidase